MKLNLCQIKKYITVNEVKHYPHERRFFFCDFRKVCAGTMKIALKIETKTVFVIRGTLSRR